MGSFRLADLSRIANSRRAEHATDNRRCQMRRPAPQHSFPGIMPHYYFHIWGREGLLMEDPIGLELSGLTPARQESLRIIREVLSAREWLDGLARGHEILVLDQMGHVVLTVPFGDLSADETPL
jgi:hypothetical protein